MLARHVGTYLAAESTALKRPSNGDPEMKADRVSGGLACQDLLAFFLFSTLFWSGTMSLGRGEEERGAGVSRSECEQCGLVRRWGPVSKAFPGRVQYVIYVAVGCCRAQMPTGCQSYARYTSHGASADLSHFGKLLEDSVPDGDGRGWPAREDIHSSLLDLMRPPSLNLSRMLCSVCLLRALQPSPGPWPCRMMLCRSSWTLGECARQLARSLSDVLLIELVRHGPGLAYERDSGGSKTKRAGPSFP